jgi:hypothetical protein
MRKLTAVFAAFALTGLAACDSVQTGAAAPTTVSAPQQGDRTLAINPALLPAGAVTGAPTAGATPQQGERTTAINPATVPASRAAGGTPTAGTGVQQGEGQNAINPALPARR